WYELIPVVSFLMQKGKCASCGSNISLQYLATELFTGALFLFVFYTQYPILNVVSAIDTVFYLIVVSLLVVITVYDWKHKIIPDALVYTFAALSFAAFLFHAGIPTGRMLSAPYVLNIFAGPIMASPFAFMWVVSRGRWMGLGDAKLALGIGWFLGLYSAISAITLAIWIGALFGIAMVLLSRVERLFFNGKTFTMKSEIPFGPFLVLGTLLVFFFHIDVLGLSNIFLSI
ncbi:MAG: prepilin peptidase, partial [Patescibacteria group bacterium]|nr:prepilin peptidase [Patescibacteria group bacterium]